MSHKRYYIRSFILIALLLLLGTPTIQQNIYSTPSEIIVSKTRNHNLNYSKENVLEIDLEFDLQSLSIIEGETYEISDFIKEMDKTSLEYIDYHYKDESMENYKESGEYEIIIVFQNTFRSKLEKKTTLKIEKKQNTNVVSSANQLQQSQPARNMDIESQILSSNQYLGSRGRLYFSSMYSVALHEPTTSDEAQRIVNNVDSASYIPYGNVMIIADHSYQGFDIIKTQNAGNFIYIKKEANGTYYLEKYVVRERTNGKNVGYDLITNDNRSISYDVNCPLVLYTCNTADGYEVTILLLDRVY